MTDAQQSKAPSSGLTVWHAAAAGGGISTLGEVISYSLAWARSGQIPIPDEGQEVAIAGLLLTVLAVLAPIGAALMNLALAWIKKITPAGQA